MSDRARLDKQQAQWLGASLAGNRKRKSLRSWLTREEEAYFFSAIDHDQAAVMDPDFGGQDPRVNR